MCMCMYVHVHRPTLRANPSTHRVCRLQGRTARVSRVMLGERDEQPQVVDEHRGALGKGRGGWVKRVFRWGWGSTHHSQEMALVLSEGVPGPRHSHVAPSQGQTVRSAETDRFFSVDPDVHGRSTADAAVLPHARTRSSVTSSSHVCACACMCMCIYVSGTGAPHAAYLVNRPQQAELFAALPPL